MHISVDSRPAPTARILMIEDDAETRRPLRKVLERAGYEVVEAADGREARRRLEKEAFDLVTVDLGLPGENGQSLVLEIFSRYRLPIIVITGQDGKAAMFGSYAVGADHYITKPFDSEELLARMQALLRRAHVAETAAKGAPSTSAGVFEFEGWRLDVGRRELRDSGGNVREITGRELDLLVVFVTRPQVALQREEITRLLGNEETGETARAIDVQISRLRRRIEEKPDEPQLIKTVRSRGYIFTATVKRVG